jgi:DNA repair photolyase
VAEAAGHPISAMNRGPVSLVTKGRPIVPELDVLGDLPAGPGCTVVFSITTLDRDLWLKLEPGTPPPWQRLAAMQRLVEAGVRAAVADLKRRHAFADRPPPEPLGARQLSTI